MKKFIFILLVTSVLFSVCATDVQAAVSVTNLTTGSDTDGGSAATTASISPSANTLVLVTVTARTNLSADTNEPTLSGNSLTYVLVNSIVYDTGGASRKRVSVFRAMGASPSSGAITIDYGGQNQTDIAWTVDRLSGVTTFGSNGSGAVVQSTTNKDESVTSPTLTVTLGAFGSANNATYAGMASDGVSPTVSSYGTGFASVGFTNTTNVGVASEFRNDNDTSADITWDSNHMLGGVAIEVRAATTIIKPANNLGLVGYWPMNEATSTQAGDFSGNGNAGTLTNGPTWVSGKLGSALRFSEPSNTYVSIPRSTSLEPANAVTLSFWVYPNGTPPVTWSNLVSKVTNGGSTDYGVYFKDNTLLLEGQVSNTVSDSAAIPVNQWTFVTLTYDGSQVQMWINGLTSGSPTALTGAISYSGSNNLYIGDNASLSGENGASAVIDDVRVYSRALTAAQVFALYKQGAARVIASTKTLQQGSTLTSGLVGLWTLDGGDLNWTSASAGVAYDGSGNNNIGTLTSMTRVGSVAIGKLGQALTFNGSSQYVTIPDHSSLKPTSITVAAWFKLNTSLSVRAGIVSKWFDGTNWGYSIEPLSDNCNGDSIGNILFTYRDASHSADQCINSGTVATVGTWYHVVATFDSTTRVARIYVNGDLKTTQDEAGSANLQQPTSPLGVGAINDNGSWAHFFPGTVDDARVYNRALSASEVKQLYNLGRVTIKP